jgi:hypothetical protein
MVRFEWQSAFLELDTKIFIALRHHNPITEPTSGLDSFQAQSVVSALKTLAEEGRTIVTVIHQPRSSIFQVHYNTISCLCKGAFSWVSFIWRHSRSSDSFLHEKIDVWPAAPALWWPYNLFWWDWASCQVFRRYWVEMSSAVERCRLSLGSNCYSKLQSRISVCLDYDNLIMRNVSCVRPSCS